jgi:hypothetical protein
MAETAMESDVQSTEITFKTITQDVFKMTFPLATTVGEVKTKIFGEKGDDFEVERQKLIYNGKVLNDTQTLGEINVDDKKYIVVMVSKVRFLKDFFKLSSNFCRRRSNSQLLLRVPVRRPLRLPRLQLLPLNRLQLLLHLPLLRRLLLLPHVRL